MKPQDFKDMYGSTPDSFKRSISNALRKTEAEEPMKKITMRAVLVTALMALLIAGVALAATSQWKLQDYFTQIFGTSIPQAGQEVLEQSGSETYTLGGAKFTRQESIADGNLVYFSTKVESMDENVILYPMTTGDMDMPLPDTVIDLYGFEKNATILDAAKAKKMRVYGVSVYPEIVDDSEYTTEMLDDRYQEDGSIVMINMLPLKTDKQEIQMGYNYRFTEFDPLTGEKIEESVVSEMDILTLPVQQPLAVRTFTASDDQISNSVAYVQSVTLTQKVTGVYVDIHLMLKGEIGADSTIEQELYGSFELLDDDGKAYPVGIIFSGGLDDSGSPEIIIKDMVSMESMPDHINIGTRETDSLKIVETFTMTDYTDVK